MCTYTHTFESPSNGVGEGGLAPPNPGRVSVVYPTGISLMITRTLLSAIGEEFRLGPEPHE